MDCTGKETAAATVHGSVRQRNVPGTCRRPVIWYERERRLIACEYGFLVDKKER